MFSKLKKLFDKNYRPKTIPALILLVVLAMTQILLLAPPKHALASELLNRNLDVLNPLPNQGSTYVFNFDLTTPANLGSIIFQFCSNTPNFGNPCTPPTSFTASTATLTSQSGVSGFVVAGGQPANQIMIYRAPIFANSGSVSFIFDNIHNTADTGTSFVRISTYPTVDASGDPTDTGGIAYAITNALDVSTEVPEFLEFCTGVFISGFNCAASVGDSIDFGEFSTAQPATSTSQFMAATNAGFGYNVILNGTTLTSGNNIITAASGSASAPGTSQFGLNLVANNTPPFGNDPQGPGISTPTSGYDQPDHFRFNNGDTIVTASNVDDFHKFTVSYLVNINSAQPPGEYASTMYFICLANF